LRDPVAVLQKLGMARIGGVNELLSLADLSVTMADLRGLKRLLPCRA